MKHWMIIVAVLCGLSAKSISVPAAVTATPPTVFLQDNLFPAAASLNWLLNLKPRDIKQLTGKQLNFKERVAFALIKRKIRTQKNSEKEKLADNGQTAFILGLVGLIALLIPFLDLASIPLAILAIAIGNKAKKADPRDRKARTGVILGMITLGVLIVIGLTVALVLTIGQFPQ